MAQLYADEDFPFGVVLILRSFGHDVLTVQKAGRSGAEDSEVLADATAAGRAVLTHNHRHYRRLHRIAQPHEGIISCSHDDNNPPGLAQRIHDAIAAAPTLKNRFIRVIRPNIAPKP